MPVGWQVRESEWMAEAGKPQPGVCQAQESRGELPPVPASRGCAWQCPASSETARVPPQVKFEMSDKTTLADLLQLNLHKYEDEVRNIVDKAVKESGTEKVCPPAQRTGSRPARALGHLSPGGCDSCI